MALVTLDAPPATGSLLVKAALRALPGRGPAASTLPDLTLSLPGVTVDPGHLAAYARVCGFGFGDALPLTYPHVLAFPLALRLMTDDAFPFPMIGLVHVANSIVARRPLTASDAFELRVSARDLRPHDKGRQFDVLHEAVVGDEVVWSSTSTYLRRGGSGGSPSAAAGSGSASGSAPGSDSDGRSDSGGGSRERREPAASTASTAPTAVWRVPGDIGRRYAAVSGDRNPIHLHALTARAFGFRRAIAHGMWTTARCVAALSGRLPAAVTVDVAFKLPILLPATVAFTASHGSGPDGPDGAGRGFAVADARSGRPHLTGAAAPLHT